VTRFDSKKDMGRGPYIGHGVRGINGKDSKPLYLQLQLSRGFLVGFEESGKSIRL
jgi:hypothetical protein